MRANLLDRLGRRLLGRGLLGGRLLLGGRHYELRVGYGRVCASEKTIGAQISRAQGRRGATNGVNHEA